MIGLGQLFAYRAITNYLGQGVMIPRSLVEELSGIAWFALFSCAYDYVGPYLRQIYGDGVKIEEEIANDLNNLMDVID